MAVSDKMVDGIIYGVPHSNSTQKAQAVINAGWTDFDPADESTWPKGFMKRWIVDTGDRLHFSITFPVKSHTTKELKHPWCSAVRYADPEHFRYEEG